MAVQNVSERLHCHGQSIKRKATLEGEGEYINSINNMKSAVMEFRKEVEQLNTALEKEIELLKKLG